jgi:FtsP/CotA-like multicopper oxidase with cupredoxin domain
MRPHETRTQSVSCAIFAAPGHWRPRLPVTQVPSAVHLLGMVRSRAAREQPATPASRTRLRLLAVLLGTLLTLPPVVLRAQQAVPTALPNDNRATAGRMVGGELRVELEAVEAQWFPRGPEGPRVVTPAFAEVGGEPSVPGPLLRVAAGTPVRVRIRNTLRTPIVVRGLLDRVTMIPPRPPPGFPVFIPAFAFGDSLVIAAGAVGETHFTPTGEVTSFYFGRVLPPAGGAPAVPIMVPGGSAVEGAFMGALVIDPPGSAPPPAERVLMITRWSTSVETDATSWKIMLNGASWPFTERFEYAEGDTVRWRVINASLLNHPMHLHGFYFTVNALGDTHADTSYAAASRPLAVTQQLGSFSAMRISWVAERPGNWLFHCHLLRHMNEVQRLSGERAGLAAAAHPEPGRHHVDGMAGLVAGITVHPAPDGRATEETPRRRIDLWTGLRPDRYDGHPELGFVVQEGPEPPAPDSTRVPGSPLVLTRGEPTEIVVHNRLDIPLSVHWHGLELPSLYDGVGDWSGSAGATRPPIPPGDSARVFITPTRAGTFMYHTHGESGHELSQGLYGPFLVLEPGEPYDAARDRVFVLAARGARRDATPAINGAAWPRPERFEPGRRYRLRFLHISPDETKRVRLLDRQGKPVCWLTLARDGADLPEAGRAPVAADFGIAVGETLDVLWTPDATGVYTLEVTTVLYPVSGVQVVQRVAFGVGGVAEADLSLPQGAALPVVTLTGAERARYVGTFVGEAGPAAGLSVRVWEERDRLHFQLAPGGRKELRAPYDHLLPLGDHSFAAGLYLDGIIAEPGMRPRFRFLESAGRFDQVELVMPLGAVSATLVRTPEPADRRR